jgi:hypothetical protein
MSEVHKNPSEETRRKKSEATRKANKGKHWFTDGIKNVFRYECPEGFVKGRIFKKHTSL